MREKIAIGICVSSAVLAALAIHAWGHPARVCLCLYPAWLFTAEWLGGRLPWTSKTLGDLKRAGVPRLTGIARGIWWASIALLCLAIALSFS